MNFNNNNEWKSYITEIIITACVVIVYISTFGMAITL